MKHILIAPLDWGLGHATRSSFIAEKLLNHGFKVSVAADDHGLQLFQEVFGDRVNYIQNGPQPYNINYQGKSLAFSLARQLPQIQRVSREENMWLHKNASKLQLDGVVSDNRFGLYHNEIPSVYVSHQLMIKSYGLEPITNWIHHRIIKKFDACWVPDNAEKPNLSGKLGHNKHGLNHVKYIGFLNRFEGLETNSSTENLDILVIASGPEPQRSKFVSLSADVLQNVPGKKLILGAKKGPVTAGQVAKVAYRSHASAKALKGLIENAETILCRPGYTGLMELTPYGKQLILVPTPGQTEQVYLGKRLDKLGLATRIKQSELTEESVLAALAKKTSFKIDNQEPDWAELFKLFEG